MKTYIKYMIYIRTAGIDDSGEFLFKKNKIAINFRDCTCKGS